MASLPEQLVQVFIAELDDRLQVLNRALIALEKQPDGPDAGEQLDTMLRMAHSLKGAAGALDARLIETACHHLESIFAAARKQAIGLEPEHFTLLFAAADGLRDAASRWRHGENDATAPLTRLLADLEAAASTQPAANPPPIEPMPPNPPDDPNPPRETLAPDEYIRVSAEKLDVLLSRSGELLLAHQRTQARQDEIAALRDRVRRWRAEWQSARRDLDSVRRREPHAAGVNTRATQALELVDDNLRQLDTEIERLGARLAADHNHLSQASRAVDETIRRTRMQRFDDVCFLLDRTVRDVSKTIGKVVSLRVKGGDTEVDRTVLQGLRAPLLHLVRNAIDHGIEHPAIRRAKGKPAESILTLAVSLRGADVEITLTDDGAGLDLPAIRAQARQLGLPEVGDDELISHIFLTGFSTQAKVTTVSGRGAGLSAVKTAVEAMRGTVGVSTPPGGGTRFTLTLPLTLTSIQGLAVSVGMRTYILDSSRVVAIKRVGLDDLGRIEGRDTLLLDGAHIPLVPLAALIGLASAHAMPSQAPSGASRIPIVVIEAGTRRLGLLVDGLLHAGSVLIESMGARVRTPIVSGAAIMADGGIALILDATALITAASGPGTAVPLFAPKPVQAAKRVVLADDSPTTLALERGILEAAGYEVVTAEDGADAWRVLHEGGADLMVSDVDMPNMDGVALTEAVRSSKRFERLPIILVTGQETETERARGLAAGADAYLVKSAFDPETLLATIVQLL